MIRELPDIWADVEIDATLRMLGERAARMAGLSLDAWMERAIRRSCPQYFAPATPPRQAEPVYAPPPAPAPLRNPSVAGLMAAARSAQWPASVEPPRSHVNPFLARPAPQTASPPPTPPSMEPPAGNIEFEPQSPAPRPRRSLPPLPQSDWVDNAAPREPQFETPEPRRRAAAFASALSGWRERDKRAPRADRVWPAFEQDAGLQTETPDFGEPLELTRPIRARRSKKPLAIAVGIALAVSLGALGAQRVMSILADRGRSNETAAFTSHDLSQPPAMPAQPQRQAMAVPASPNTAVQSAPEAPVPFSTPSSADTGALLQPSLVSPQTALPPPPPVTATAQPTPPRSMATPTAQAPSEPMPIPAPAPKLATAPAQPDLPPPLPARKMRIASVTPPTAPVAAQPSEAERNARAAAEAAAAARKAAQGEAPKDPVKLAAWLDERAKTGDTVAEYRLGVLYALGQGVKQDYSRAAQLFRAAAEGGVAEAQYNVAVMYGEGMGVTRDPAQAVQWYQKAAAQGNANAAFNLGVAYSNGAGVKQDIEEAAHWFRRAAAAGVINAQFNLGLLYERGEGVPANTAEAYAWYAAAASRGDQGAAQRRDHLASVMAADELKKAQARAAELQQTIRTSGASPGMDQKASTR
jgi:uncharacterized protein